MSWHRERIERLRQIVAELVKRNITPNHNNFASVVISLAAGFGLSQKTANDYIATLISSWKYLKWKPWLQHNDYLTEEEIKVWMELQQKS